jgi:hypothetical protein
MSKLNNWKSQTALIIALGLTTGTVTPILAPLVAPTPVFAQTTGFSDVPSDYWAKDFIQALAAQGIIAGYQNGTFRPDAPVTRAQFAAMVNKAFNKAKIRNAISFVDVPSNYWANSAIRQAYEMGFLAGYSGNVFRPEQNIPREQVLVALANGLNYSANNSTTDTLGYYNDASAISNYARNSIAAATEKKIVVNYPNTKSLTPTENATRAEVAAFIYQALVSQGNAEAINSPYVVSVASTPPVESVSVRIPSGTTIPVRYDKEKILVTPDEKVPLTLRVAANITTANGRVLIPSGSQVVGQLQPAQGGTEFVAQTLTLPNGQQMSIDATSEVITKTEQIKKGANIGTLIKDTALGAAAAAAISGVTGDRRITAGEVLGGGGLGTLAGIFLGRSSVDLIVIDPQTDLNLRLNQPLVIGAQ